MKKLTIVLFATLLSIITYSQIVAWGTQFEPPYDGSTHLGTFYMVNPFNAPGNLWQVGRPLKPYPLDTTFTPPNALLTDTVNPYPVNCHSSFELHFGRQPGYENLCWSYMLFTFMYRIDADTGRDGIYVEIMYNGSNQWKNIIFDNMGDSNTVNAYGYHNTYKPTDTLFNGEPGISYQNSITNHQGWNQFDVQWFWNNNHAHMVDSVAFRITFVSDSIDTHKGGVLIDNISLYVTDMCNISVDEIPQNKILSLYPNPVTYQSVIDMKEMDNYDLSIYDITGKQVFNKKYNSNSMPIGTLGLHAGIYSYIVKSGSKCFNGKFIVQP